MTLIAQLVATASGEVRDADGNLLNQEPAEPVEVNLEAETTEDETEQDGDN